MASNPSRRLHLFDLVAAIVACALIATILVAPRTHINGRIPVPLILIFGVIIAWRELRSRVHGPTCDECGKKFQRDSLTDPPTGCPHCGAPHAVLRRLASRQAAISLVVALIVPLTAIPTLMALRLILDPRRNPTGFVSSLLAAVVAMAAVAGVITIAIGRRFAIRSRQVQANDWTCQACGGFVPVVAAARSVCLICSIRKYTLDHAGTRRPAVLGEYRRSP